MFFLGKPNIFQLSRKLHGHNYSIESPLLVAPFAMASARQIKKLSTDEWRDYYLSASLYLKICLMLGFFRVVFIRSNTIHHRVHSSLLLYRLSNIENAAKRLCNLKSEGERRKKRCNWSSSQTHRRVWNSNVVNINMPLRIGTVYCYAWNFQLHFEMSEKKRVYLSDFSFIKCIVDLAFVLFLFGVPLAVHKPQQQHHEHKTSTRQ